MDTDTYFKLCIICSHTAWMINGRYFDVDDYETKYNLFMQEAVESGFLNDVLFNTSVEDLYQTRMRDFIVASFLTQ